MELQTRPWSHPESATPLHLSLAHQTGPPSIHLLVLAKKLRSHLRLFFPKPVHRVLRALLQRSEICSFLCIPLPPSNPFFQLQPVISRLKSGHVSPWCEILLQFPIALRLNITLFFRALRHYTICLCPPALPALPPFLLVTPHSLWDLSSAVTDWTCIPCSGSSEY